ncbi:MAG TPA: glycosyltransferase family A protein [Opitutaceae bacterium]|nr:glycosyltransferase family A protein [Opitutaceae bacterium]
MDPLVSVIILTFNSQDYIGRALKSLRRQTYPRIEIVVVDNGSTDQTKQIVESFGNVVWLSLPHSDMGMARNHGVKHCGGDYLMFLDSDDFYLAHKVESQVRAMKARPELDVLFSPAYIYRTGRTQKLGIKLYTHGRLSFADFLAGQCYTLATICIRRSAWDSHGLAFGEGEFGRDGEDWRFQLSLAQKGMVFDVLTAPAVVVEIREDSHTSWDIQPRMKALALSTVEGLLSGTVGAQLGAGQIQSILDGYRFKLAVSQILVGRKGEARVTLRQIQAPIKVLVTWMLLILAAVLPAAWMRRLLELTWTKRQDKTFHWCRLPQEISMQIDALNSGPTQLAHT